jgi:hypothetical protein
MKQPELNANVLDTLIDRVVEGVVPPEELRAIVEQLERDPAGWKRCALAFLEAQALNESFRAFGNVDTLDPIVQPPVLRVASAKRLRHRWLRTAAAAAILAAAFAIGWVAHGTRSASRALEHSTVGLAMPRVPSEPAGALAAAEIPRQASLAPVDDHSGPPVNQARAIRAVATIRFGPANSHAEVPVLAGPGITAEWLVQQPPPVSEHGQVALARQGYQVQQERRFFTTVLADGRRLAVPVDHVQIHYTGNEPL